MRKPLWSLAAAAAAAFATAGPVAGQPDPGDGWARIILCAKAATTQARHDCTDDVLRRAGLLAPPARKTPAVGAARPEAATAVPQEASEHRRSFGLPAPTPRAGQRLDAVLADARVDGEGKLVLTTAEGAVWRQAESEAILPPPRAGQALAIEKASLGGYVCRLGRWVAFRCLRLQ
jgi:hypothetical protein